MKTWRCDLCKRERLTDDNIVEAICRCCVKDMELVEQREKFVSKVKEEKE